MVPEDSGSDLRPNLRSMPLRHEEYSLRVPKPLLLATKLSLRELVERIPKDRKALQDLTIGGQKPYAAFVPTCLDWNTVNDLETLQRLPGFSWAVLPVRGVQNTESRSG